LAKFDLHLAVGDRCNRKQARPMSAPSEPTAIVRQAFKLASRPGRALAIRKVGALPDFDNITVRIADVAAYLAIFGDRRGDELGSSTLP